MNPIFQTESQLPQESLAKMLEFLASASIQAEWQPKSGIVLARLESNSGGFTFMVHSIDRHCIVFAVPITGPIDEIIIGRTAPAILARNLALVHGTLGLNPDGAVIFKLPVRIDGLPKFEDFRFAMTILKLTLESEVLWCSRLMANDADDAQSEGAGTGTVN